MIEDRQHLDFDRILEILQQKLNLTGQQAYRWLGSTRIKRDGYVCTPVSLVISGNIDELEAYIGELHNGSQKEVNQG